jgi:hypothetical protein
MLRCLYCLGIILEKQPRFVNCLGCRSAKVQLMQIDVTAGRSRVKVGPPDGPQVSIPGSLRIELSDIEPYDVELRLEWVAEEARLSVRKITYSSHPLRESVRVSQISKIPLGDVLKGALETECIGVAGWSGIVDQFSDYDKEHVDALVYLLAVALDSPRPSATVATARGLSPSSGPKRVADARKAGLIPKTEPGRASGA